MLEKKFTRTSKVSASWNSFLSITYHVYNNFSDNLISFICPRSISSEGSAHSLIDSVSILLKKNVIHNVYLEFCCDDCLSVCMKVRMYDYDLTCVCLCAWVCVCLCVCACARGCPTCIAQREKKRHRKGKKKWRKKDKRRNRLAEKGKCQKSLRAA